MDLQTEACELAEEFCAVKDVLFALGDANRQHILTQMIKHADARGMRVGEIVEGSNLSRPTVSHHLALLKKAGIIAMREEGTRNYYYFDAGASLAKLQRAISHAQAIDAALPGLRKEEFHD